MSDLEFNITIETITMHVTILKVIKFWPIASTAYSKRCHGVANQPDRTCYAKFIFKICMHGL